MLHTVLTDIITNLGIFTCLSKNENLLYFFCLAVLKEDLKTATKIALLFLMRVFSKLAYLLSFFTSFQNDFLSKGKS